MPYSQMAAMGQPGANEYFRDMVLAAQEANRRAEWIGDHFIPNDQGTVTVVPAVPEAGLQEPMFTPGDVAGFAGVPAKMLANAAANAAKKAIVASALKDNVETHFFSDLVNGAANRVARGAAPQRNTPANATVDLAGNSEPVFPTLRHASDAIEFLRRAYDIEKLNPDVSIFLRQWMPSDFIGTKASGRSLMSYPTRPYPPNATDSPHYDAALQSLWDRADINQAAHDDGQTQLLFDVVTQGVPAWRWNK